VSFASSSSAGPSYCTAPAPRRTSQCHHFASSWFDLEVPAMISSPCTTESPSAGSTASNRDECIEIDVSFSFGIPFRLFVTIEWPRHRRPRLQSPMSLELALHCASCAIQQFPLQTLGSRVEGSSGNSVQRTKRPLYAIGRGLNEQKRGRAIGQCNSGGIGRFKK
jgi:hypothetical protein